MGVRAVVNPQETERIDLKSLPEGYVILRRMSYGEYLQRRDLAMDMEMEGKGQKDMHALAKMMNKRVSEYEFSKTIVEHNLEDENGQLLNFSDPRTLERLDPRVGEEIGAHIDRMNSFGEDAEAYLGKSAPQ
jgi:hypothetical protein